MKKQFCNRLVLDLLGLLRRRYLLDCYRCEFRVSNAEVSVDSSLEDIINEEGLRFGIIAGEDLCI